MISAQKASTANAFGLDSTSNSGGSGQATGLALSTANLYSAVQPGGSLFGLQFSNPVDVSVGYHGPYASYGTPKDPMTGGRIGGVNVFGGGLGLYAAGKKMVGGVGVSGDTSCADHNIGGCAQPWPQHHSGRCTSSMRTPSGASANARRTVTPFGNDSGRGSVVIFTFRVLSSATAASTSSGRKPM